MSTIKKVSVIKIILGIAAGILISFILAILMVGVFPFYLSEYIPIFLGALVAGFIIKEKPWLAGLAVAVLMAILSLQSLMFVIFSIAGKSSMPEFNIKVIIALILYLPVGVMGSYCGCCMKRIRSS